mmetsp:Transcript_17765/g.60623  ORF Transcript_17765/g.60623 Transcript_17765/m.60623 type:complete len:202 (-) Transcript_17765:304-909(-)
MYVASQRKRYALPIARGLGSAQKPTAMRATDRDMTTAACDAPSEPHRSSVPATESAAAAIRSASSRIRGWLLTREVFQRLSLGGSRSSGSHPFNAGASTCAAKGTATHHMPLGPAAHISGPITSAASRPPDWYVPHTQLTSMGPVSGFSAIFSAYLPSHSRSTVACCRNVAKKRSVASVCEAGAVARPRHAAAPSTLAPTT